MGAWIDVCMDGGLNGWMHGWMCGWMGRHTIYGVLEVHCLLICFAYGWMYRWFDV